MHLRVRLMSFALVLASAICAGWKWDGFAS
jgi:hypothetical protein